MLTLPVVCVLFPRSAIVVVICQAEGGVVLSEGCPQALLALARGSLLMAVAFFIFSPLQSFGRTPSAPQQMVEFCGGSVRCEPNAS